VRQWYHEEGDGTTEQRRILKDAAVSDRSAHRREDVPDVTSGLCYQVDVDEAQETLPENGLRGKRISGSRTTNIEQVCCIECVAPKCSE